MQTMKQAVEAGECRIYYQNESYDRNTEAVLKPFRIVSI